MKTFKVLDLFSGCGGFSSGFDQAGFKIVAALDKFPDAIKTLKHNHKDVKTFCCDITKIEPFQLFKKNMFDVIIGGPPCQGFSVANPYNLEEYSFGEDPRNFLYKHFFKYIKYLDPQAFVMENVKTLNFKYKKSFLNNIIDDFQKIGFNVNTKVLKADLYGVPQFRERLFIVGIKGKVFDFNLIPKTNSISAYEAIGDLPKYPQLDPLKGYPQKPFSDYQKKIRNGSKFLYDHTCRKNGDRILHILSLLPPNGNQTNLPDYLAKQVKFNSNWIRLKRNCCAQTITCSTDFYHWEYCRSVTLREYARLQSFFDTYKFFGGSVNKKNQIGNAVPPFLAKKLGETLLKTLEK